MSYQNSARLGFDAAFRDRTITCCKEQALIFKDDGRPEIADLADRIIENPANANGVVELVCVAPGFGDIEDASTITDAQILSAVQAVWPTYAGATYSPPLQARDRD